MPPKDKKKAEAEVDVSDVSTLPKANICLFQMRLTSFASAEVRQKVYDQVTKNLPDDRFQTLTK